MDLARSLLVAIALALLLAVANGSSEVQVVLQDIEKSSGGDSVSGYMESASQIQRDLAGSYESVMVPRALLSEPVYKDLLKRKDEEKKSRHYRKIKGKHFRRGRKSPPVAHKPAYPPPAYKPRSKSPPPPYKAPKPTKSPPPYKAPKLPKSPPPYKAPKPTKSPPPYKAPKPTKSPPPPTYKAPAPKPLPSTGNRYYYRRSPPPPVPRSPPPPATSSPSPSATQLAYLNPHNAARAKKSLAPLAWDTTLEKYARDWGNHQKNTDNCNLEHSSGPYGENLFWGGGGGWTPGDAVQMWVEEEQYYNYAYNSCASGQMCGHYTQVVWASTTHVGCASVSCNDGSTFITCSYNPPGNWVGEKPY